MKELAAPLNRLSLSGVRARRQRSALYNRAPSENDMRNIGPARQDSFDSQRTMLAGKHSSPPGPAKGSPPCDQLLDIGAAAWDYLHAGDRQAHNAIHEAFAQADLFARLPAQCGLRRLTLFFVPIAIEPSHTDETEARKRSRACLNLAHLLLPAGGRPTRPATAITLATLQARDASLDALCRKLHLARQLMRMRRCVDSQIALQQAMEQAAALHRESVQAPGRARLWPFSETYRALFEAEWIGLRAVADEVLRQDGWPDDHPSYTAMWNLERLARDYRLNTQPVTEIPQRRPLKRSMTASSLASRQLGPIAEEYSAFSDSDSSDENDNCSERGHDPLGYDGLDSELWATPPPSTTVTEATSWRSLNELPTNPASAPSSDGGERLPQEPSMRWSDIVHPGRLWDPKKGSSDAASGSRHSLPKARQEKVAMNQRTRPIDGSESLQPRPAPRPPTHDPIGRNASDYGRGDHGALREKDGFGGFRPVFGASARPAGASASGFQSGAAPDNAPSLTHAPDVPARHQSIQSQRSNNDTNQTVQLRHAADVAARSVSQWGQGAVPDNAGAGHESDIESEAGSEGPLDQALRELGLVQIPDAKSRSDARFGTGAPYDNAAVRPLHTGAPSASAPRNNQAFASDAMPNNAASAPKTAGASKAATGAMASSQGFGIGGMPDNATGTPSGGGFSTEAMFDNAAPRLGPSASSGYGVGAMPDNAAASPTKAPAGIGYERGPMPDNAATAPAAPSVKFESGAMPNNARPGRSMNYAKLDRGAVHDGRAPREAKNDPRGIGGFGEGAMHDNAAASTTPGFGQGAMFDNAGRSPAIGRSGSASARAITGAVAAPDGAEPGLPESLRIYGTVATTPEQRRASLFSSGLVRPISTFGTPAAAVPALPKAARPSGRTALARKPMPTSWRSQFDAATNAAIERVGAAASLDALVKAFGASDYAAALQASQQAYAQLTSTYWSRSVMRKLYTEFFVGTQPDALSNRLHYDWALRHFDDLRTEVAFLQHMASFLTSASQLSRSAEMLPAYASWQPDWATLEAYDALLLAIDASPNATASGRRVRPTQALRAIRTQLQLRGPIEHFEILQGTQTVYEEDPAEQASEASSMWAAIDRALWRLDEPTPPQPSVVVLNSQRVVQITCSSREALETYYNDMEAFLETMVRKLARTQSIDADDLALLCRVQQARSVELACDELKARFAPARERA